MVAPPEIREDANTAIEATDEDIDAALHNALRRAGCDTVEELAAQARAGTFATPAAMRAWVIVRTLAS